MRSTSRPVLVPQVVSVRLDDRTGALLLAAAKSRRITISDVLRHIITTAVLTMSPIPVRQRHIPNGELLAAILAELGKIGSNLNQLARSANRYQALDPTLLMAWMSDLKLFRELIFKLTGGDDDA